MLKRAWLFVSRALVASLTLFPIWLAYVVPFVRMRRGATIPPERWRALHEKHAPRFYRLAVRMRGGLIKIGQIMSTRVDILPIEWTSTLSALQDRVDPLPWLELEPHVRRAYGRSPHEVFETIDEKPKAAASFGQVHKATTPQGEDVALKIRYPDAEVMLGIDLWTLRMMLPLFNVFVPHLSLKPIYGEISRSLRTELDYEQEARFTQIIHENFRDVPHIHVPRVLTEYTRRDVICTTWFEGKKITDPALLADPRMDRRMLLELVIETWIKMMYVDGVFQSDPHPGNLLARIGEDGKPEVCVVDFGQVKILTREFHQMLVKSVMCFVTRDVDQFLDTLSELGLFGESEKERARPLITKILERYSTMTPEQTHAMDFTWIREEVIGQIQSFRGVTIPQELVLYGRTFALLAGLSRSIDPTVDAFALAKPHFLRAMLSGGPPDTAA
ncbi:MAG: AarF/UbiB family protein [Myxococcota bacterium]|nr:AarF/UbiB family protein [Myxococcota bacterium]